MSLSPQRILLALALTVATSLAGLTLTAPAASAGVDPEARAACTQSFGGDLRWDRGKVFVYGRTNTCKTTKWTKACATLWYHVVPGSRPWASKCVSITVYQSRGFPTPKKDCIAGLFQANVRVFAGNKVVGDKWSKNLDGTSGCPGTGKTPVRS